MVEHLYIIQDMFKKKDINNISNFFSQCKHRKSSKKENPRHPSNLTDVFVFYGFPYCVYFIYKILVVGDGLDVGHSIFSS